jgi:hypothetical protein
MDAEAVKAIGYGTRKLGRAGQKQDISGAISGAVTKFRSVKDD